MCQDEKAIFENVRDYDGGVQKSVVDEFSFKDVVFHGVHASVQVLIFPLFSQLFYVEVTFL